jgi:hypothetical protein
MAYWQQKSFQRSENLLKRNLHDSPREIYCHSIQFNSIPYSTLTFEEFSGSIFEMMLDQYERLEEEEFVLTSTAFDDEKD